jgi:organic radical activating enzyme
MRRDKELTIEITSKCSLNCAWCSTNATPEGKYVPKELVIERMREWQYCCNVVRLSGGEPLQYPYLKDILVEAKRYLGYRVVLLTNGQYLLPFPLRRYVDEIVVHLVNSLSFSSAREWKKDKRNVSVQVVNVLGREAFVLQGLQFALEIGVPFRVLALQKQGRGIKSEPSKLITWTGIRGCNLGRKVTVGVEGKVTTCSAFKNRPCDIDLK